MKIRLISFSLSFLLFSGCEDPFEKKEDISPISIYEEFWRSFNNEYAGFKERNVNWNQVYEKNIQLLNEFSTNNDLFEVLANSIKPLNDGHIVLIAPNRPVFKSNIHYANKKEDSLFSLEIIKNNYLIGANIGKQEGNLIGAIDEIGYWHLQWVGENLFEIDTILEYFSDKLGIIIDLRHNWGGDFTYAITELGRLTDKKRIVFSSKTKNGPQEKDYTKLYKWHIEPKKPYFNKPILLLTDRYTISAAERMAMILKTLPNTIHIGDTTNGALSTKIGKELSNGWYYSMAPQKVYFADGINYEGIGLIPDLQHQNTYQDLQSGKDFTLELALEQIRSIIKQVK